MYFVPELSAAGSLDSGTSSTAGIAVEWSGAVLSDVLVGVDPGALDAGTPSAAGTAIGWSTGTVLAVTLVAVGAASPLIGDPPPLTTTNTLSIIESQKISKSIALNMVILSSA